MSEAKLNLFTCAHCQKQFHEVYISCSSGHFWYCSNCNQSSCSKYRNKEHSGLSCAQFQNHQRRETLRTEKEERFRTELEEVRTAARIRKCPNCKRSIIKVDGCDHITCPCGVSFCYRCQKRWGIDHLSECQDRNKQIITEQDELTAVEFAEKQWRQQKQWELWWESLFSWLVWK